MSATEKKFGYTKFLESTGATRFGDDDDATELSTVIVRCSISFLAFQAARKRLNHRGYVEEGKLG